MERLGKDYVVRGHEPRETASRDEALRAVISNLFDIPLRASYRAVTLLLGARPCISENSFTVTYATMDESPTQGYPYVLHKRISRGRNKTGVAVVRDYR